MLAKVGPSDFTDTVETPCHNSVNSSAFDSTPFEDYNTEIKEEPEEYEEEYYDEENCDVSQSEPVSETVNYEFNDSHTEFATRHNNSTLHEQNDHLNTEVKLEPETDQETYSDEEESGDVSQSDPIKDEPGECYPSEEINDSQTVTKQDKSEFLVEKRRKHKDETITYMFNTLTKRYHCKLCEKDYSTRWRLLEHIRIQHDRIPFQCEYCQKTYASKSTLNTHILSVHKGMNYKCERCERTFNERTALKAHMKTVHQIEMNLCEQQRSMTQIPNIKIPEFKCDKCYKVLQTKKSFRNHMKSHLSGNENPLLPLSLPTKPEPDKTLKCDKCDKIFTSVHGFQYHMENLHTKQKEHKLKLRTFKWS